MTMQGVGYVFLLYQHSTLTIQLYAADIDNHTTAFVISASFCFHVSNKWSDDDLSALGSLLSLIPHLMNFKKTTDCCSKLYHNINLSKFGG